MERTTTQLVFFLFTILLQPTTISTQTPSPPPLPSPHHHHHLRSILLGLLFGCLVGFLFSLFLTFSLHHLLLYLHRPPLLVVFSPTISPKSLHLAVSGQTHLPDGKYHRVLLTDGLAVAVKIVGEAPAPARDALTSLEVLAAVRHRNVMPLRAYVRDPEREVFALVYDYVPTGSLEEAMRRVRGEEVKMGWEVRQRIAVGVVKGLRYLHFECSPRILHCDLKPANVLLDDELEPRLADSGVVTLLSGGDANAGAGFSWFAAPECGAICRYTDKCDIFSFGVILAMLLTGKDPSDPFFCGEFGSLGRWLRHLQQTGEARQALDKGILGEECEEDEMLMAVRIAVVCLSDSPSDRPSSDELVAMLTQLHSF